jgi:hypothetical protein
MKFFTLTFAFLLLSGAAHAQTTPDKPTRNTGRPGCNPTLTDNLTKAVSTEGFEYGDMSEITECRTVFIHSQDYEAREKIIKEMSKAATFRVVGKADEADFFIDYFTGSYTRGATVTGNTVNKNDSLVGELLVSVRGQIDENDKRHLRVVWGKKNTQDYVNGMTLSRNPATNLTRDFLKALKKFREEKK